MKHHLQMGCVPTITENKIRPIILISLSLSLFLSLSQIDQLWQYPFIADTGHSRYVDFAYLDTTTYVEVILNSQHFFSIFLCISTLSMSKMVNMKQWVSRGDFSCPRCIFYYICYCLCRSRIVCFGYVHVLAEV